MIELKNVHKAFGPKQVLRGFTLTVNEGETMVIIGYSGTGKSVAIKHIVGLLEPDQGTVFVDGLEVPALSRPELAQGQRLPAASSRRRRASRRRGRTRRCRPPCSRISGGAPALPQSA